MAIVVEDGTGLAAAVSYLSVADADTHHTARGNSQWTDATSGDRETALVRATDYIDKRFGRKFRGGKISRAQALEWPRSSAADNDGFPLGYDDVPTQVEKATAEYALRALLIHVLAPDAPAPVPSQNFSTGGSSAAATITGEVTRKKVQAGEVLSETEYRTLSQSSHSNLLKSTLVSSGVIPEYPEADLWLEELLVSPSSVQLLRA